MALQVHVPMKRLHLVAFGFFLLCLLFEKMHALSSPSSEQKKPAIHPTPIDDSLGEAEETVFVEPIADNAYAKNPITKIQHALRSLRANEEQTILHDRSLKESSGVWKTKFLGREAYGVSAYLPEITTELTKIEAQGHLKNSWPESVVNLLGENSMIAGEGETFQKARKIFSESMTTKAILSQSLPGIQQSVEDMYEHWLDVAKSGATTVFAEDVSAVTYSVIVTAVFGGDSLTKEEFGSLRGWTDTIAKGLFSFPIDNVVTRRIPFFRRYSRAMQARKEMKAFISEKITGRMQAIEAAISNNFESTGILDGFLLQGDLSKEQMINFCVDNVILSIFAGYDTTASVSTNMILMLHEYATADEVALIRKELNEFDIQQIILSGSLPPGGVLDAVPSLKSAVYESFRWRPVVGGTFRRTTANVTLGNNVQIPANTTLQWSNLHGSKSSLLYEKPDRACPMRFLGRGSSKEPAPFMFGYGKHMCPGQFLAQIEILLVMKTFCAILIFLWNQTKTTIHLFLSVVLKVDFGLCSL